MGEREGRFDSPSWGDNQRVFFLASVAKKSAEGLEDGAAFEAALNEHEGNEEKDAVGGPGSGEGGNLTGIAEGEKDFRAKKHECGKDDGQGDGAATTATGKADAQRGGKEHGDEAEPRLCPAIRELGLEGAGLEGDAVGIVSEPVGEAGDAEVAGVEAFLNEERGSLGPIGKDEGLGEVFFEFCGGLVLHEEAGGLGKTPVSGLAIPAHAGRLEAIQKPAVGADGADLDVEEGSLAAEVVGKAADVPETIRGAVVVNDVVSLGCFALAGGFEEGLAIATGPRGGVKVEEKRDEGEEAAKNDEGSEKTENTASGLGEGNNFAGGRKLTQGVKEAEEDGEGEEEDHGLGEKDGVIDGEEFGGVSSAGEVGHGVLEIHDDEKEEEAEGGDEEGDEGLAKEVAVEDGGEGIPKGAEGGHEAEGLQGHGAQIVELLVGIGKADEIVTDRFLLKGRDSPSDD